MKSTFLGIDPARPIIADCHNQTMSLNVRMRCPIAHVTGNVIARLPIPHLRRSRHVALPEGQRKRNELSWHRERIYARLRTVRYSPPEPGKDKR